MRYACGLLAIACCAISTGASAQARPPVMSRASGAHATSLAIAHRSSAGADMASEISLEFADLPLRQALAETALLSRLHLVYADGLIPTDARVTLQLPEVSPSLAFAVLLTSTNLRVVISPSGYAAIVKRQRGANVVLSSPARFEGLPHTRLTSGIYATMAMGLVQDEGGHPIAGVYVRLCGTRRVELTDSLGRFTFSSVSGALPRVSASAANHSDHIARVPLNGDREPPRVLRLRQGQRSLGSEFCPEPVANPVR